jgi:hypothetical protein
VAVSVGVVVGVLVAVGGGGQDKFKRAVVPISIARVSGLVAQCAPQTRIW